MILTFCWKWDILPALTGILHNDSLLLLEEGYLAGTNQYFCIMTSKIEVESGSILYAEFYKIEKQKWYVDYRHTIFAFPFPLVFCLFCFCFGYSFSFSWKIADYIV